MITRGFTRILLPLLSLSCMELFAQSSGTIRATVKGSSGAPIPNAAATLTTSGGAGPSQSILTGPDGTFTATNVAPGIYRIDVEMQGFKRASVQDVEVGPGGNLTLDITLEPGDSKETVLVQGRASGLQDSSGDHSRNYTGEFIRQLPLLDRNQQFMTAFMPGITPPSQPISPLFDPQRNWVWQANGLPFISNYHSLDGVQNDEPFNRLETHVAPLQGVQQVQVLSSNYDASQGRAGGSVMQTVLQTGNNEFHGSLFSFNSNAYTRSRDYFNPTSQPQSRYNFNQFGATVGAPIIKNKTFFFGSWETRFFRQQIPTVSTVPTAAFANGDFSGVPNLTLFDPQSGSPNGAGRTQFPGNVIPASRLNPVSQALVASMPQPNQPGFENNLFSNVPASNDGSRFNARIDHRFSDNTTVFARYGYTNDVASVLSPLGAIGSGANGRVRSDSAVINGVHTFGPTLIGELRIGYNRYANTIRNATAANAGNFGLTNLDGSSIGNGTIPSIQIAGMNSLGQTSNFPQFNNEGTFNLVNSWSKRWSRHDIRFGADIWWTRLDGFQTLPFGPQGGFLFSPGATMAPGSLPGPYGDFANSFAGFMLGAPVQSGVGTFGARPSNLMTAVAGYVADNFQVTPKLTLTLGLRYDYFTPVSPRRSDGVSIYDPATNDLVPVNTNGFDKRGNVAYQNKNFAPRVGFAYRVMEQTVIRGGYGISYWNTPLQFAAASFITGNVGVQNGVPGTLAVAPSFNQLPPVPQMPFGQAADAPNFAFSSMNTTMPTPYVQNYNVQLQHAFGQATTVDVGYVGTLGRHMPLTQELNAAFPGTGIAGLPFNQAFGRTAGTLGRGTDLTSNYNALQVNVSRRLSQGLTLAGSYTYSRAFDFGSGLVPLLNNLDVSSNYGPSNFNRAHVFSLAHAWALPFGKGNAFFDSGWLSQVLGSWSLNGVLRYSSGPMFTPTASAEACACPGNTALADVNGNPVGNITPANAFFPVTMQSPISTFAQPAIGQFGNAGRNVVRGQGFTNYDLAVTRGFSITERAKVELRGEAYNIANSSQLALPVANVNSAFFGQSTSTTPWQRGRTIQFGLKLQY